MASGVFSINNGTGETVLELRPEGPLQDQVHTEGVVVNAKLLSGGDVSVRINAEEKIVVYDGTVAKLGHGLIAVNNR